MNEPYATELAMNINYDCLYSAEIQNFISVFSEDVYWAL